MGQHLILYPCTFNLIIHAKFGEKIGGQGSKFCMGSQWDFLVKFATPRFRQVSSKFTLKAVFHNFIIFKTDKKIKNK